MSQSPNTTRSVAGEVQAFCGLGFDLERVIKVARCMTAKWVGVPAATTAPQCDVAPIHRLAGYELLVSLGREIRGR